MTYSGNSALSQDMRERIESTYRQTLELAAQGNRQEASLGCDFILRLDQDYEPARKLLERLEQGEGPVVVDDLRPGAAGITSVAAPGSTVAADPVGANPLANELRTLRDERRFGEALERAAAQRDEVMADPELRELVGSIQERQEAEPFITELLDKARADLRAGDAESAARHAANARELDPNHPDVVDFQTLLQAASPQTDDALAGLDEPLFTLDEPSLSLEPDDEFPTADPAPAVASTTTSLEADPEATNALSGLTLADLGIEATVPESADDGGDDRIHELLQEGQGAFDDGRYQDAIDAWSRIFLIDIDHKEAAQRIDEARKLKAEQEREVEDVFHEGVAAFEKGDAETARARFERVRRLQPSHLAAREYLTRLDEGGAVGVGGAAVAAGAAAGLSTPTGAPSSAPPGSLPGAGDDEVLSQEILVPPSPGEAPPASTPRAAATTSTARTAVASSARLPSRKFMLIGGAVLILVIALTVLLFQNRSSFFGNTEEALNGETVGDDPVQQAMRLYERGQTDLAERMLDRVQPGTPHYDDAQARLAQWRAAAEADAEAEDDPPLEEPPSVDTAAERAERRAALISAAQDALERQDNLYAASLLEEAGTIVALDGDEQQLLDAAREATEPLSRQIALIRGSDWERAAGELWRLYEEDRSNRDVRRLLADSYHNLGVRELQRNNAQGAAEHFRELVSLEPNNAQAKRQLSLARTYQERDKDLLFEIYARKIPFRGP